MRGNVRNVRGHDQPLVSFVTDCLRTAFLVVFLLLWIFVGVFVWSLVFGDAPIVTALLVVTTVGGAILSGLREHAGTVLFIIFSLGAYSRVVTLLNAIRIELENINDSIRDAPDHLCAVQPNVNDQHASCRVTELSVRHTYANES